MQKKLVSIVLMAAILVTLVAGCGSKSPSTTEGTTKAAVESTQTESTGADTGKAAELKTVTFVLYGDQSKRMSELMNGEFAQKFKDEINTEVKLQYIPWGEGGAGKKIDLMLAAGEDFDATLADSTWVAANVSKKSLADLTEVADKYLTDFKKVTPKEAFDAYTINGKLYGIPIGNKPTADAARTICVRQDILEEVGMTDLKTIEDVDKFYTLAKAKHPDMYATPDVLGGAPYLIKGIGDRNLTTGFAIQGLFLDQNTGKFVSIIDSPEFKELCNYYRKWYTSNLLPKDLLTSKAGNVPLFESGKFFSFRGSSGTTVLENLPNLKKNVPTANIKEYSLKPEKTKIKAQYENTAFQVPVYSKKADRVAMVLNLLQKDTEHVDFFTYGVKDKDYTVVDNKIHTINKDELFYQWMLFNAKISTFDENFPNDFIPAYKAWDDGAAASKDFGLAYNFDNIKSEKAKVEAVVDSELRPLAAGMLEYAKYAEKVKKSLTDAGFEKVVNELQSQLDTYLASKK